MCCEQLNFNFMLRSLHFVQRNQFFSTLHLLQLVSDIRTDVPSWKDNMSQPLAEREDLVIIPGKVEPEDFHHAYAEEVRERA